MPFRYVKDDNGEPIMPKVSVPEDGLPHATLTGCTGNARADCQRLSQELERSLLNTNCLATQVCIFAYQQYAK
jgi:hypothetical protein